MTNIKGFKSLVIVNILSLLTPTLSKYIKVACDDLIPERIAQFQDNDVIRVSLLSKNQLKNICMSPNVEARNFLESLHGVQIDDCANINHCKGLITNLKNIVQLNLESTNLREFDFSLISSNDLSEINLNGNAGIMLRGSSIPQLVEFSCVGCNLDSSSIEALLQFKDSMVVIDLRGNNVDENEIRKQFPNLQEIYVDMKYTIAMEQVNKNRSSEMGLPNGFELFLDNISKNTTNISLTNYNVSYVEYDAFSKFENMTYLNLTGNLLKTFNIAPNELQVLDLSVNQITYIDCQLLLNSSYLKELYLEQNSLKSIDWNLNAHANLHKVILNENQLTTITLISPTLQELWIKFENGRMVFSTTSKMEQLTFLETSGTETDADLCWLSNSILMIRSTQEDKICKNSTTENKVPVISFVKQKSVNCGLSTLRANYDDIIISKDELTIMWMYALLATVIVLFVANCVTALMYIRNLHSVAMEKANQIQLC